MLEVMLAVSVAAGSLGAMFRVWFENEKIALFTIITGALGGLLFWWILQPENYLGTIIFGALLGYVMNDICNSLRVIGGKR